MKILIFIASAFILTTMLQYVANYSKIKKGIEYEGNLYGVSLEDNVIKESRVCIVVYARFSVFGINVYKKINTSYYNRSEIIDHVDLAANDAIKVASFVYAKKIESKKSQDKLYKQSNDAFNAWKIKK